MADRGSLESSGIGHSFHLVTITEPVARKKKKRKHEATSKEQARNGLMPVEKNTRTWNFFTKLIEHLFGGVCELGRRFFLQNCCIEHQPTKKTVVEFLGDGLLALSVWPTWPPSHVFRQ